MFRPSAGVLCLLCNNSVLRRRRMTITHELLDENPEVAVIITENLQPYQLCIALLVVAAVSAAEEKKTEKRGVLGLGYGAPLLGHGGYYGHGLGLYNHALVGHGGLYGGGLYGGYGHGLYGGYGHGIAPAPLLSHAPIVSPAPWGHGLYGSPLLGLGHGYLH